MGENISDLPNLKNKWPRWILKGDGVSISSKREKEKLPSSQVGQGWIKVGDILSDPDSSNVYPTIIFQPSQLYLCAEEIISPPTLHHEVAIIIEGGILEGAMGAILIAGGGVLIHEIQNY